MLDTNKKTIQTHPSLLPLRAALIAAERDVPSQPDVNEQLADTLTSFNLREVIGSHV